MTGPIPNLAGSDLNPERGNFKVLATPGITFNLFIHFTRLNSDI